jgi:dipeptidyl aminopeptidase/acylaminoacyl peptidase
MKYLITPLMWALSFVFLFAQPENKSVLSLPTIMQGEDFVGHLPEDIRWHPDGSTLFFSWNPNQDTLRSTYRVSIPDGTPELVSPEQEVLLPGRGNYSSDRSHFVYSKGGDLFFWDLSEDKPQQLTYTVGSENRPRFFSDDEVIVYYKGDDLFAWEIETGVQRQLIHFSSEKPRKERPAAAYDQWLEDDQLQEFDVLRERKAKREARERRSELVPSEGPSPIYLNGKSVRNVQLSPDMRYVVYQLVERPDAKSTDVPNFVTESGYVEQIRARSKVGSPQATYESWIYDRELDTSYQLRMKDLPGIYEKPAFLEAYHEGEEPFDPTFEQPRATIVHGPEFSDDGKALVDIRSMDNKDRWIALLELETGALQIMDRQHDEAWIGGPGISGWNFVQGNMGWLPDNETVWFQSEATGFSKLYLQEIGDDQPQELTPAGDYEVWDTELSLDEQFFFLMSNRESPFEHHFYRLEIATGKLERITTLPGGHQVSLSPDEQYIAVRYSHSNQPWELFLMPNEKGAEMRKLTESTTVAFQAYPWREPEIVTFKADDGAEVPARLYRPAGGTQGGPAVIFVHGAGYLQNVHRWWSSYYREYMFHNMLVDNGYTVLDIDYRASEGYGRDWRTAIYQHMGGRDLKDQINGANYLVETYGIDENRIGIYGGSYGGFITLMALFEYPGVFQCGAALRSVTDWAHYNHPYTSNILNTPVEDPEAFRRSSPIYHADGLEDHLLILHGMVDDNVQFQDVVRLSQRLIELGKENWELSVFPVEPHGFVEPSSWTDEYRRIFELFQTHLK